MYLPQLWSKLYILTWLNSWGVMTPGGGGSVPPHFHSWTKKYILERINRMFRNAHFVLTSSFSTPLKGLWSVWKGLKSSLCHNCTTGVITSPLCVAIHAFICVCLRVGQWFAAKGSSIIQADLFVAMMCFVCFFCERVLVCVCAKAGWHGERVIQQWGDLILS